MFASAERIIATTQKHLSRTESFISTALMDLSVGVIVRTVLLKFSLLPALLCPSIGINYTCT